MGPFFVIDERLVDFQNPTVLVKDEYMKNFNRKPLYPYLLSEVCAIDMLYAIHEMEGGELRDKLVLKGGMSVRNYVPLLDHRFSFDLDFNPNTYEGYTFGKIDEFVDGLRKFGRLRRCNLRLKVTRDTALLRFIEVGYHEMIRGFGAQIVERPKIEFCKPCRVLDKPSVSDINTMIDLKLLGLKPIRLKHLNVEEQLASKLFVIGARGRQRNHFDAYDAYKIQLHNANTINWKKAKQLFETQVLRRKAEPARYVEECRHQLHAMLSNRKKMRSISDTLFAPGGFDFGQMVQTVSQFYAFKPSD